MRNQDIKILVGDYWTSFYQDYWDVVVGCEADFYIDSQTLSCSNHSITAVPTINPKTGCQCGLFIDPMENTTSFEKDILWDDRPSYYFTQSTIEDFSRTFSSSILLGNELVKACTAFDLEERGYSFSIIVGSEETSLKKFCEERGWRIIPRE
jgi:hypothetical protein